MLTLCLNEVIKGFYKIEEEANHLAINEDGGCCYYMMIEREKILEVNSPIYYFTKRVFYFFINGGKCEKNM